MKHTISTLSARLIDAALVQHDIEPCTAESIRFNPDSEVPYVVTGEGLLVGGDTAIQALCRFSLAKHFGDEVEIDMDAIPAGPGPIMIELLRQAVTVLQEACHGAALEAGWWHDAQGNDNRDNPLCFSSKLCLIHSEVSESMEGDRKDLMDNHLPHRPMREVELADNLIRSFDLGGAYKLDLAGALTEKMAYNAQRADHKREARQAVGGKAY